MLQALQSDLSNLMEERYQLQLALRAAQKELDKLRIDLAAATAAAASAPPPMPPTPAQPTSPTLQPHTTAKSSQSQAVPIQTDPETVDRATSPPPDLPPLNLPPPSFPAPENAQLAALEGALRQATVDYQMLLQGEVVGGGWCPAACLNVLAQCVLCMARVLQWAWPHCRGKITLRHPYVSLWDA